MGFFHALSAPSDGALQVKWMVPITRHCGGQITIARIKIARSVRRQMGEDRGDDRDPDAVRSMNIQRSSIVHVSQGKQSILIHLLSFLARVVITDRVESGPRDRGFPPRSDARRVATSPAINKIVWEHSPTRKK